MPKEGEIEARWLTMPAKESIMKFWRVLKTQGKTQPPVSVHTGES